MPESPHSPDLSHINKQSKFKYTANLAFKTDSSTAAGSRLKNIKIHLSLIYIIHGTNIFVWFNCVTCVARSTHRDHSVVLRDWCRLHTFNYYMELLLNHLIEFNKTYIDFTLLLVDVHHLFCFSKKKKSIKTPCFSNILIGYCRKGVSFSYLQLLLNHK